MDSWVVFGVSGLDPVEGSLIGELFVVLNELGEFVIGGVGEGLGVVGPLLAMCDFVDDEGFLPEGDEVRREELKSLKKLLGGGFGDSQNALGCFCVPVGTQGGLGGCGATYGAGRGGSDEDGKGVEGLDG